MEMDWNEFLERAVGQTILALEERPYLPHGQLPADRWFRTGEAMVPRPHPVMLEHYQKWAWVVGLVIGTYLNHLFAENRVTGNRFVLYCGKGVDINRCYAIHHGLSWVVTEHIVIRVVQAFITALHESPDFASWRENVEIVIRCPNGGRFVLYDHNGSPGFRRL